MKSVKRKVLKDGINRRPHIKKVDGIYICLGVWLFGDGYSVSLEGKGFNPSHAYTEWQQQVVSAYRERYSA